MLSKEILYPMVSNYLLDNSEEKTKGFMDGIEATLELINKQYEEF